MATCCKSDGWQRALLLHTVVAQLMALYGSRQWQRARSLAVILCTDAEKLASAEEQAENADKSHIKVASPNIGEITDSVADIAADEDLRHQSGMASTSVHSRNIQTETLVCR